MITQEDYPIKIGRQVLSGVWANIVGALIFAALAIISNMLQPIFDGWILFTEILIICCFFGFFIILSVVFTALALNFISYSLDKKNFVLKSGIIARSEKTLPFSKIQHVVISQSFPQRIFGVANLMIQTAGQDYAVPNQQGNSNQFMGPSIPGIYLKDAEKLRDIIIKNVLSSKKADL